MPLPASLRSVFNDDEFADPTLFDDGTGGGPAGFGDTGGGPGLSRAEQSAAVLANDPEQFKSTASELSQIRDFLQGEAEDRALAQVRAGTPFRTVQGGWKKTGRADPMFSSLAEMEYVPEHREADPEGEAQRIGEIKFQGATAKKYQDEQDADPFTGTAARARTAAVQSALDTAATTERPEIDAAARTTATRAAFGQFLNAQAGDEGKAAAAISPAGRLAAEQAARGKVIESLAGQGMVPTSDIGALLEGRSPVRGGGGGPAAGGAAGSIAPVAPADGSLAPINHAILDSLDPQTKGIVQAMIDYRFSPPGGYALARSPQMRQYVTLANQIDPEFDATMYEARQKFRDSLATGSSATAIQLKAAKALADHLKSLDSATNALGNFNGILGTVNAPINAFEQSVLHRPKFQAFNVTRQAVEAELTKLLAGQGRPTDAMRKDANEINQNSTPDEIGNYTKGVKDLALGQLSSIRDQLIAGLGARQAKKLMSQYLPDDLVNVFAGAALDSDAIPAGVTVRPAR